MSFLMNLIFEIVALKKTAASIKPSNMLTIVPIPMKLQYSFIVVQSLILSMQINFSYLKHPPELYLCKAKQSEVFTSYKGKRRRIKYFNLPYSQEELKEIEKFKKYAQKHHTVLSCQNQDICRYLYSEMFDYEMCLLKIKQFEEWIHNPDINIVNSKIQSILLEGFIYTFGRDKLKRPIVFMDLTKIQFDKYTIEDYYGAINAVLNVVLEYRFVKGYIENYLWILDLGGQNFTSLPIDKINSIIKKLAIIYSMYLGHMLVVNVGRFTKILYQTAKGFIDPETVRKITLLNSSEKSRILEFIDRQQISQKYNGSHPDLTTFWPPQLPYTYYTKRSSRAQTDTEMAAEESSVYYSIVGDNQLGKYVMESEGDSRNVSCCHGETCRIF